MLHVVLRQPVVPAPRHLLARALLLTLLAGCSPAPRDIAVISVDAGRDRFTTRMQAAQRFYAEHPGQWDFLVMWWNGDPRLDALNYLPVSNDVRGLGYDNVGPEIFDQSAQYGATRLGGIVWMGSTWPALDNLLPVLAEETGHRWGVTVRYATAAGESNRFLRGDGLHWSALVSNGGSPMGGKQWVPGGGRTFLQQAAPLVYSDFDLYLMGLQTLGEVAPLTLLVNVSDEPAWRDVAPSSIEADIETIPIERVISVEGSRIPDASQSPRVFRQAFLHLLPDGAELDRGRLDQLDQIRRDWQDYFQRATRGRGTLHTTLD
jgi:hypothetical protein